MNLNTYLPDDLGQRAKAAGLNLSALLRAAVIKELDMIDTMKALSEDVYRIEITMLDRDEIARDYAFTGRWLTDPVEEGPRAAITARGQIFVAMYKYGDVVNHEVYGDFDDVEADDWQGYDEFLADVAQALGSRHVIEMDI